MIIAICNQKGGVAKTTTTINLASCLAELGYKVLAIDNDPQCDMTIGFDIDFSTVKKGMYELIMDDNIEARECIIKTKFGVDIIPTNINLANAEVEISSMLSREELLLDKINSIKNEYDYIFIDCNPALGLLTLNALVATDHVIIPIEAGAFSLQGSANLQTMIAKIRRKLNPGINLFGILITKASTQTNLVKTFKSELREIYGDRLFKTIIHNNIKIADAQMENMPINFYDKKSKGYEDYMLLAKEIINNEK